MSKRVAIFLMFLMLVSVGTMSTAVGGAVVEQPTATVTDVESQSLSVTKTVSINKTVGAQDGDRFNAIEVTSDGGYIAVGSFGSGLTPTDMWAVKFDSSGNVVWNKTYSLGDSGDTFRTDVAHDVVETSSGYVMAGKDSDAGVLVKINDQGTKQWAKNYGGRSAEFKAVVKTSNGYTAAGKIQSSQGDSQAFLVRVDSQGAKQWSKQYGAVDSNSGDDDLQADNANDLIKTGSGGFVFVGVTDSYGAGATDDNVWILKTNGQGVEQWNKSFGKSGKTESAHGVVSGHNGGYVIAADRQPELWGIKVNEQGTKQWDQFYLTPSDSSVHSGKSYLVNEITQTNDGNYLMIGEEVFEDFNTVAVKISSSGTARWNTSFPNNLAAEFSDTTMLDVAQTSSGDFVFSGKTGDFGPGQLSNGILMKIGFSTSGTTQNQPPTASISANSTTVQPGETISFSASASDPNGDPLSYSWELGDGTTASGASATHAYSSAGNYTVTLTVTDGQGGSETVTETVTVESDGAGSTDPLQLRVSDTTGAPNSTVTVELNVTNTNETAAGVAVNVTGIPTGWSITGHTNGGADTYKGSTNEWVWFSLGAGSSGTPTVTLSVPNSTTPGQYTITAEATTGEFTTTATGTVTISKSGAQPVDQAIAGNDNTISTPDLLNAINYWQTGNTVPNTNGKTIDTPTLLNLIDKWQSGETV